MTHPFFEKPPYVWPNPDVFPFRIYLDQPEIRIFFIDCVPHNWAWLSKYYRGFRDTDVFIVFSTWSGVALARNTNETFEALGLNRSQFIMLCNDQDEVDAFSAIGLRCVLANNNAFIDYSTHMGIIENSEKLYDAIYIGRRTTFKRHMLARKVEKLAIIAGNNHGNNVAPVPERLAFLNNRVLNEQEVMAEINKSNCGLILSASEGACFASSEYLLCGIPVVSTHSTGGRDVWYNNENSIVCEPDEDAIAEAVNFFSHNQTDPHLIRDQHIAQSLVFRKNFIDMLQSVFDDYGVDRSASSYFEEHYIHKMRTSMRVDMKALFGPPLQH